MPPNAKSPLSPPLPASATASSKNEKYQLILDAAVEVIAQNGFHNSRVSEIADRAGVADGTIYLYFKNKEQVLMAALDSAFHHFLERARGELGTTSDARERLRRLAHLHLDSLGANRNLAIVFQTELRQSAKFLAEFSHRNLVEYFSLIRTVIREGQSAGQIRGDISDKIAANCFFGALDEMVTSWILSEHEYPLAAKTEAVVDIILRGVEERTGA